MIASQKEKDEMFLRDEDSNYSTKNQSLHNPYSNNQSAYKKNRKDTVLYALKEKTTDGFFTEILEFIETLSKKSPLTVQTYLECMLQIVEYNYKNTNQQVSSFPQSLDEWRQLLFYMRSELKLEARTQLKILSAIKSYAKACDSQLLQIIEKLNKPKLPEKKFKALTEDEKDEFFETAEKLSDQNIGQQEQQSLVLWTLLYGCGLRISEALQLTTSHFVFSSLSTKEDLGYLKVLGKGNKERVVPMPKFVEHIVRDYISLKEFKPDEYIFRNKKGERLSREHAGLILLKFRRQYALPDKITLHTLRHTFVTHLLEKNACVRAIQMLVGHASLSTLHSYAHVSLARLKEVHKKANEKNEK